MLFILPLNKRLVSNLPTTKVESILTLGNDPEFLSTNGIMYKISEVEWLDEIREEKLKELGI